ncbi:Xanthine/uracil/vitamin C permease [Methanolobus psychrophilus R15]|nr:Xanthine/uracil/vitamin C permease [Methanolobus psychrophilus R15]
MAGILENYFHLKKHGTDVKTEIMAGIVTFMTVAYIIVVNPAILQAAGIPFGPSMVATILSAVFGTLLMGVYAKKPIAIAPYMGENAFVAYTVVGVLGYSWQTALGAVFISGVLFTILTISGLRNKTIDAVPDNLKYSFAAGLGLFITFIGLVNAGVVSLGVEGAPLHVGALNTIPVALTLFGFLVISTLMIKKVKGSILIGIIITAILGFATGVSQTPDRIVSMPPSIAPILFQLDIAGALTWGFFAVILTMFTMDLMDTMGTLVGVSLKAGYMDEQGRLDDMEKPFLADALATMFGALAGTTTTGAYIESATGIEEGGRTGFTAVVIAFLFTLGLFFYPVFSAIPPAATSPALIVVGLLMMGSLKKIDMEDLTEMIPAMAVIILMSFTYNLGVGLCAGFVLFPLLKLVSGKRSEVKPIAWALFVLCSMFFIFYPY